MEKKITYDGAQNWITATIKGEKKRFRYPISFNHLALMEYNPKWDIGQILIFEKFLVMYNHNKCEPIYYQGYRLEEDLHIGRGRIETVRKKFKKMGILTEKAGKNNIKMYSLDKDRIIELLQEIYNMPEEEAKKETLLKELKDFFNFFLTKGGGTGRFQLTGKIKKDPKDGGEAYDIDYSITEK